MGTSANGAVAYQRLKEDEEDTFDNDGRAFVSIPSKMRSATAPSSPNDGSANTSVGNYGEAVEAAGFGKFHAMLLIVCGWANMSDAVEILSVSFLLPNASHDMNITSPQKGLLTAIIFVGMLVGGYMWGSLADFQGRRQILIYSLACNATFGLISSVSQNFWLFLFMRFASGVGVGGSIPVIFSYFSEFQPSAHRGAMVSGLSTFWMFGNIVTAALAWAIIPNPELGFHKEGGFSYESWRIFIALCCIPAATSSIMYIFMPESPKYLLERGEQERAIGVMRKIYCWNHKNANPEDYPIRHLIPSSKEDKSLMSNVQQTEGCCRSITKVFLATKQLFVPPLRRTMIAMIIIIFSLSFGYYGLWMWFPELFLRVEHGGSACSEFNHSAEFNSTDPSDQIYRDGFYTALSNLPGNLLTIVLMDRLGRKFLLSTSLVISGISVFFIWFLQTRTQVLIMSIVFGAISVVSWNTLNVVGVELYPTICRTTALGVQSVMNRLGAILGSLMFGVLIDLHCAVPMILIAILLAIGGLVTLTLPNTTKIELK